MNKDWMEDPALCNIERKKLEFLHMLFNESASLSQKELLPFLLSLSKRSRDEKINFTNDEVNLITHVIRANCPADEQGKIDQLLKSRPGF